MRKVLPLGHGRLAIKLLAAAAVSALMAGCSTDSTRLSDPFSDPFTTSSTTPPPRHLASTIPAGRSPPIVSQALPAPSHVASAPALRPNLTRSAGMAPISRETTGSIEPGPVRTAHGGSFGGWSSSGGVPITVGQGETADILSKRYGVPATALLQTNGLSSPSDIHAGTNLVIPVYSAAAAAQATTPHIAEAAPAARAPAPAPSARASLTKPKAERMAAAEKRVQERAPERVASPKPQAIAKAEPVAEQPAHAEPPHPLRAPVAEKHPRQVAEAAPAEKAVAKPSIRKGTKVAAVEKPAEKPIKAEKAKPEKAKPEVTAAAPAPAAVKPAKPAVVAKAPVVKAAPPAPVVAQAAPAAEPAAPAIKAEPAQTTSVAQQTASAADPAGNPEFRWPARGRIIQGFKGGNDGINIALPDGTPIKAAENGTVAYAGSELKGYGNLVLIRHPNGYVTAYANNGELDVKRGDQVKRGQVIAKSGQSGNVSSPQLHFELRKGSTPVDPTTYLAGL